MTTVGGCRYRQAIPLEGGGRLDKDTNFGIRRGFLPQVKYQFCMFILVYIFTRISK